MRADIALTNGTIVTATTRFTGTIGINGERIAFLASDGTEVIANKTIDVSGKFIIPGAIDAHVHFQDPGATDREDLEHGSMACAAGGITTAISQPVNNPPVFNESIYLETLGNYEGRSLVDYGLHGGGSSHNMDEIESLWLKSGAPALKIMMCYSPKSYGMVDDAQLMQIMEILNKHDGLAYVHAENQALVEMFENRFRKAGRSDPMSYIASRPAYVETEAVQRVLTLAEQTGCRVILAHVSCVESLELIAAARKRGTEAYAESCPHFFTFVDEDIKKHGPYLKFSPVMRDEVNLKGMWECLERGLIDTIGSDHCPYRVDEKVPGEKNIWDAPNGIPGLEVMLPVLLDGVSKNKLSLERLVEVTSYNPARIYGLSTRKGDLVPGYDADLVVVDLELEKSFQKEDIKSKCPYSPYLGLKFRGWPIMTMVRGTVACEHGDICVQPGHGTYVSRKN